MRKNQQVHMIGHDDPGLQFIKPLAAVAIANCAGDNPRHSRIIQP